MAKRKRPPDVEDLETSVRTAAASIAKRFEGEYPEPTLLARDAEFLEISERLAKRDVPFSIVDRTSRGPKPIICAIGHRAAALRDDVPAEWLAWAWGSLK